MFTERRKVLSGATTENDIVIIKNMSKVQDLCIIAYYIMHYLYMLHRDMKTFNCIYNYTCIFTLKLAAFALQFGATPKV